jgi:hypothetical protein
MHAATQSRSRAVSPCALLLAILVSTHAAGADSVTVINAPSNPAFTVGGAEPWRSPYVGRADSPPARRFLDCGWNAAISQCSAHMPPVPKGSRLVLQQVQGRIFGSEPAPYGVQYSIAVYPTNYFVYGSAQAISRFDGARYQVDFTSNPVGYLDGNDMDNGFDITFAFSNPGFTPDLNFGGSSIVVVGYVVDCNAVFCAPMLR